MDIHYELNGLKFLWNAEKAKINISKHDGISFEQAATVFFDPFFRLCYLLAVATSNPNLPSITTNALISVGVKKTP